MYTHPYVVLISEDNELVKICQDILQSLPNMKMNIYSQLSTFLAEKGDQPISGLIVDLKISMKATGQQKHELNLIESVIPILRIKKNQNQSISGICRAISGEGVDFLREIFKTQFTIESTRQIRLLPRKQTYLNVLVSKDNKFDFARAKKMNTVNISLGGMFIHTTDENSRGDKLWIMVEDSKNIGPIEVVIRWVHPWGKSKQQLPGIGVEFLSLSDAQKKFFDAEINQPWLNFS